MIVFSAHALKRMRERGITRSEIAAALKKPDSLAWEESNLAVHRKKYGLKTLEVVAEIKKSKFIV